MLHCQRQRRIITIWLWLVIPCTVLLTLCLIPHSPQAFRMSLLRPLHKNKPSATVLVVASQLKDNTTWLKDVLPGWDKVIFVTDDANALNKVPANRGREAMAYLTYIVENYDFLPTVMVFQHANQYQWHNDDPLYDGSRVLSRLQTSYIEEQGYVSLRCVWTVGCPAEIHPLAEDEARLLSVGSTAGEAKAEMFYKQAFEELFPGIPVPVTVGCSCCAQFAVSGQRVRERPRSDYERYRQWLLDTPLVDRLSGRIMEYSWHIIFGEEAVYCPNASSCYCKIFGLCNIQCEQVGVCESQYTLPQFSLLPDGWPDIGWNKEWRNVTELRAKQELDFMPTTIAAM